MGEAIPLGQAIKATKDLCTSNTETPYRDIIGITPGGPPGAPVRYYTLTAMAFP